MSASALPAAAAPAIKEEEFDEEEYQDLCARYLLPRVREKDAETAGGTRLRRQTKPSMIDMQVRNERKEGKDRKAWTRLKKKINSLKRRKKHGEIYRLLKQLRKWETTNNANLLPGFMRDVDDNDIQEVIDLTEDGPEVIDVDKYIIDLLLVEVIKPDPDAVLPAASNSNQQEGMRIKEEQEEDLHGRKSGGKEEVEGTKEGQEQEKHQQSREVRISQSNPNGIESPPMLRKVEAHHAPMRTGTWDHDYRGLVDRLIRDDLIKLSCHGLTAAYGPGEMPKVEGSIRIKHQRVQKRVLHQVVVLHQFRDAMVSEIVASLFEALREPMPAIGSHEYKEIAPIIRNAYRNFQHEFHAQEGGASAADTATAANDEDSNIWLVPMSERERDIIIYSLQNAKDDPEICHKLIPYRTNDVITQFKEKVAPLRIVQRHKDHVSTKVGLIAEKEILDVPLAR